jgi:hypothetical protein
MALIDLVQDWIVLRANDDDDDDDSTVLETS